MSALIFTGKITEISEPRTGTTEKGEWASVEFEVTESQPQNALYPQVGKFDLFKNGEYLKYAKDFKNYYPLSSEVVVEFNLKMNEYTRDDHTKAKFYKTSAWKVTKVSDSGQPPVPPADAFEPAGELNEEKDDLPF